MLLGSSYFLASQDIIIDIIFEWLEFPVEVQTEKNRKSATKNRKKTKDTEKTEKKPKNTKKPKKPNAPVNFKFGTGFFGFFRFFWVATPLIYLS